MTNADPVITELDAEIDRLEGAVAQLQAELRKAREMREWWDKRHPIVVQFGEAVETEQALPIEVVKSTPTLRKYVLAVLDRSVQPLTVPEIRDVAIGMGWQSESENKGTMVRNTLMHLIDEEQVVRIGERRYARNPVQPRWQLDESPEVEHDLPTVEASPAPPG